MKALLLSSLMLLSHLAFAQAPGSLNANLKLWLKANKDVMLNNNSLAIHNDSIALWYDQSFQNNHANQNVSGRKPIFKNDSLNNINYNPYININKTIANDSGQYMLMNQNILPNGGAARTIFVVAQPTSNADKISLLFFGDQKVSNTGDFVGVHLKPGNGNFRVHLGGLFHKSSTTNILPGVYTIQLPNLAMPMTKDFTLRKNGLQLSTLPSNNSLNSVTTDPHFAVLGAGKYRSNPTGINKPENYWDGKFAELCVYESELSENNILKIESYLALKYGICLDTSYYNYASTNIWDKNQALTYHNDIIGISREDSTDFIQKQSTAYDNSYQIYLSNLKGLNAQNTGSFLNNNAYLIAGHNDDDNCPTSASNLEIPSGSNITERIAKEYRITKTNFAQNFNIDLAVCSSFNGFNPNEYVLLVDDDGDFTNASYYQNGTSGLTFSILGNKISVKNIPSSLFANNTTRFLTIGRLIHPNLLPVELIQFSANREANDVQLNWQTATEINNHFFTIERSRDALNWKQIAKIDGAGNSNRIINYQFVDKNVPNTQLYYRLKQTDFDEQFSYSDIEYINAADSEIKAIKIYPNPCQDRLYISFQESGAKTIYLYSNNGSSLRRHYPDTDKISLNTEDFAKGVYILSISSNQKTSIHKFVKL